MNYNEVEILAFKENFSPDVLKKYSGIELLKLLAYPKNPDNNIKEQFKELYEENYNSLKNELENRMTDFGSGSAGFDTNFVLAYRQGSWHNLKKKISFNEAIKIAENIKSELIQACSYLENNNFNEFYNYVSKSTSGLFNKGYTHKYFYILYPKFISFYHAGSWQQYFKECLKLPSSYNFYDIERYFLSNYPDCHVGEKSRELEDEYGLPYDSQYWLRSANSSMYDHKGAFDKFGFIDWRQHNKFNVNDIVYIYSSANDKRIRYKTIVAKIDIPFSEINDDHEFWRNEEEYQKSKEGKYVRLKLIKEVFNESLSYENLKKLNFIDNIPQGSVKIKNKNFIEFLNSNFGDNKMSDIQKIEKHKHEKFALNQILYGPPGTGKTYNTVIKAMKIINPSCIEYDEKGIVSNYSDVKNEFDKVRDNHQIEFITFHQSYSYEEFVEGIKPDLDTESWNEPVDKLTYKGSNGIFKTIANRALFERLNIQIGQQDAILDFKNLKEMFIEEYSVGSIFKTGAKNAEFRIDKYTKNSARITPINGNCTYSITFKYLEEAYNKKMTSQSEIATINGVASGLSCYYFAIYEKLLKIKKSNDNNQVKSNMNEMSDEDKLQLVRDYYEGKIKLNNNKISKPYVLIIDEINRGNISKIFGELITLIEEDKRENMSVKLPYSQETFTVPKNLYIIGTMNTSDRSIASIDIALRRRFIFKEIMPNVNLVPDIEVFGIELRKIFTTLNERISILLDRDHQIGHSYFMKLENSSDYDSDFKRVWYDCVMPLLNEYFYGDWEKLCALLGDFQPEGKSFIKKINNVKFANSYSCDEDETYDFVSEANIDFEKAIKNAFKNI